MISIDSQKHMADTYISLFREDTYTDVNKRQGMSETVTLGSNDRRPRSIEFYSFLLGRMRIVSAGGRVHEFREKERGYSSIRVIIDPIGSPRRS
jgi:hypothetical protein